jgi:hypothetical protein
MTQTPLSEREAWLFLARTFTESVKLVDRGYDYSDTLRLSPRSEKGICWRLEELYYHEMISTSVHDAMEEKITEYLDGASWLSMVRDNEARCLFCIFQAEMVYE